MFIGIAAIVLLIIFSCISRPIEIYRSHYVDIDPPKRRLKVYVSKSDLFGVLLLTLISTVGVWLILNFAGVIISASHWEKQDWNYFTVLDQEMDQITDEGVYFDAATNTYYIHYYNQKQIPVTVDIKGDSPKLRIHTNVGGEPAYVNISTRQNRRWFWTYTLAPQKTFTTYEVYLPNTDFIKVVVPQ